jgi:hypothetical protein
MDTVMEETPGPAGVAAAGPPAEEEALAAMENESRFAAAVHNAQASELRVAAAGLRELRAQLRARIGVHNALAHEQAQAQAQLRAQRRDIDNMSLIAFAKAQAETKAKAKAKGEAKSKTKSTDYPPGVSRKGRASPRAIVHPRAERASAGSRGSPKSIPERFCAELGG